MSLAPPVQRLKERFYPNGYGNGTTAFYSWLRQHVSPETRLLNLGAGPATKNPVRILRGSVARVVAADPDPVVLDNPEADERLLITDGRIPVANESFDVVLSDYVLEHVRDPFAFMAEAHRVLKPSGSFFFRTPNRRHYVIVCARMVPERLRGIANRVRRMPADAHEPWPAFYKLNTRADILRAASAAGFVSFEHRMVEPDPSYLVFHWTAFMVGVGYERLVNSCNWLAPFRANIFGRLIK